MAPVKTLLSKLTKRNAPKPAAPLLLFLVKPSPRPEMSEYPLRLLIIGAGSWGRNYAKTIVGSSNGVVAAVAEPDKFKREFLGRYYIWGEDSPGEGQYFNDWREFLKYEQDRWRRVTAGKEGVLKGVDVAFVCILDEMYLAQIKKIGRHYSNIYGELGEVYADSRQIVVEDFNTGETKTYYPHIEGMGHGSGD
ncbi:hypothetical protein EDB81DRAFT_890540 [Dactylonectria macrodidyma]|uniref:Gfo/Idh/MocA-like oxidoreductase N-terminal domain-containing protein n=1 Tax=Dactylonectria macrodidyma TaxID=307937 RepID=A0A9P9IL76_9HYPO|nr:hypothetical protein EDB81DRAFT_890540 [Dactylonectria macrodidyma]